jgi:cell wall-associated NlpC family hydrolase
MSRATLRARLGVTAASLIVGIGIAVAPAALAATPSASPAVSTDSTTPAKTAVPAHHAVTKQARLVKHHDQEVRRVIHEARRQKGKPYIYGDAGPHGFDCSGLVRFVFMNAVHRSLPHNASAQYHSLRHISRKRLQPGDLIFTDNGYISHVGIFAGHHRWWVAPHSGTHVQLQHIYSAHFLYARVLVFHKHV